MALAFAAISLLICAYVVGMHKLRYQAYDAGLQATLSSVRGLGEIYSKMADITEIGFGKFRSLLNCDHDYLVLLLWRGRLEDPRRFGICSPVANRVYYSFIGLTVHNLIRTTIVGRMLVWRYGYRAVARAMICTLSQYMYRFIKLGEYDYDATRTYDCASTDDFADKVEFDGDAAGTAGVSQDQR